MTTYTGVIERYEETPTHMFNVIVGGKTLCISAEKAGMRNDFPAGSSVEVKVTGGFISSMKGIGKSEGIPKPAQNDSVAKQTELKVEVQKPVQKPTELQGAATKAEIKESAGATKATKTGDTLPTPPTPIGQQNANVTLKNTEKKKKIRKKPELPPEPKPRIPLVAFTDRVQACIMQQNCLERAVEIHISSHSAIYYVEDVIDLKDRLFADIWEKSGMPMKDGE